MAFSESELKEFQIEAGELLDQAESGLLALDRGEDFESHYAAIFRAFHSIKGAAGMMELADLQAHMHKLENTLTEQKGHARLEKPFIDLFLRGADAARLLLNGQQVNFNYEVIPSATPETPVKAHSSASTMQTADLVGKILIIDDEAEILSLLSEILLACGFEVKTLQDATGVAAAMTEFDPDVVLTDIAMPGINGIQVLKVVKEIAADVPVIFLSGFVSKEHLIEGINQGVFGVLEKPFDSGKIITTCRAAAERHRLLKLLNKSVNLILYQFSELQEFLLSQDKPDMAKVLKDELNQLLENRRVFRARHLR